MYTKFELIDQSGIASLPVAEQAYKPLFLMGITSDKGPEEFTMNEGKIFFQRYGDDLSTAFEKHGQPLIEAANIINSGGRCFVRRVVAPDSALANVALFATLKKVQVQKKNAAGQLLYTDATTGQEVTVSEGNTPIMIDTVSIAYSTKSLPQTAVDTDGNTIINTIETISTAMYADGNFTDESASETSEDGIIYPLLVVTDNGRGVSNKKFRIVADYQTSKSRDWMNYSFEVMEGATELEKMTSGLHPDATYLTKNISIQSTTRASNQIKCKTFDDAILALFNKVAALTTISIDEVKTYDLLFGKTRKGVAIPDVAISGVSTANLFGIPLENGSNGSFGTKPIIAPNYTTEMVKVYDGTFDDCIYDLDNYKFDIIPDANFDGPIKRAIESLVTFREDCVYLRDLGTGLKSVEEIQAADTNSLKNKFCYTYQLSYDIIDPYSRKQVTVTCLYDIVERIIKHFTNGRNRPFCGLFYGVTFPNAIEGTVNFVPKITPSFNQKDILNDLRINYASYYDGTLVLESCWSSQEELTQFSYLGNILATQELMKAIRTRCPQIRYQFADKEDLQRYSEDVNAVINKYAGNFQEVVFEYFADATMEDNKIYYAGINVRFRNFFQSELFKLTALPSNSSTTL